MYIYCQVYNSILLHRLFRPVSSTCRTRVVMHQSALETLHLTLHFREVNSSKLMVYSNCQFYHNYICRNTNDIGVVDICNDGNIICKIFSITLAKYKTNEFTSLVSRKYLSYLISNYFTFVSFIEH